MANKPKPDKPNPHEDWESAYADLARDHRSLADVVATLRWVVGFGFGILLISIGIVGTFASLAAWWSFQTQIALQQHQSDAEIHAPKTP